mmetsp:Transcript_7271/g.25991  ORF Transcript_7271/g.25991 Transcript_7271/m.25991 type:complete len:613 (-) Transcript_7271:7183-9021(-)
MPRPGPPHSSSAPSGTPHGCTTVGQSAAQQSATEPTQSSPTSHTPLPHTPEGDEIGWPTNDELLPPPSLKASSMRSARASAVSGAASAPSSSSPSSADAGSGDTSSTTSTTSPSCRRRRRPPASPSETSVTVPGARRSVSVNSVSVSSTSAAYSAENSSSRSMSVPTTTRTVTRVPHDAASPSQTPQASMWPLGQHVPAAVNTPGQHTPVTSTTTASPSHSPHASITPDVQQAPSASTAGALPAQHTPLALSTPESQQSPSRSMTSLAQATGTWQKAPVYPEPPQSHRPSALLHVPRPEQRLTSHRVHGSVLHALSVVGRPLCARHAASATTRPSLSTQKTPRVIVPPSHSALHSDQSSTTHENGSHACVLHATDAAGCVAAPPQKLGSGDGPPSAARHSTERVRTPPSQRSLQTPHAPTIQTQSSHSPRLHSWRDGGRVAASQLLGEARWPRELTHATSRRRTPSPQGAPPATLQSPYSPATHENVSHACWLQARVAGGASPAHCDAAAGLRSPSTQVTSRVCTPPPHEASQAPQRSATHPNVEHGRSKQAPDAVGATLSWSVAWRSHICSGTSVSISARSASSNRWQPPSAAHAASLVSATQSSNRLPLE